MVLQHVSSTETSHKVSKRKQKEAQRLESLENHPGEKPFPDQAKLKEKRVR
jgi:hypothetical protein